MQIHTHIFDIPLVSLRSKPQAAATPYLCLYMYVYLYIYMHCMRVCIYIHTYIHLHIFTRYILGKSEAAPSAFLWSKQRAALSPFICIYIYASVYMHTYIYTNIHIYIYMYIYICIYMYIFIDTYIYDRCCLCYNLCGPNLWLPPGQSSEQPRPYIYACTSMYILKQITYAYIYICIYVYVYS